jgi:hypothetical protein
LTPFDVTSAIQESLFYLLNIFLAKGSSKGFKQYKLLDSFWCYISYTEVPFWPTEHNSGPRVLDLELSKHTHWLLLILLHSYKSPYFTYFLNFLYILIDSWCFISYREGPYLICWTHFWSKGRQKVLNKIHIDSQCLITHTEVCCYIGYTEVPFWPT